MQRKKKRGVVWCFLGVFFSSWEVLFGLRIFGGAFSISTRNLHGKRVVVDHFTTFAFFSLARSFAHLRRRTTFFDHRDHSKKKYPSDPTTLLWSCNKWPQRCYIWLAKTQVWGPVTSYFKICVANKFRFPFLRRRKWPRNSTGNQERPIAFQHKED